jgi:glycerophosphoryl diester phosphodiesterase
MSGANRDGVLLLAHRGLPSADRPENTLAAVRAAFECGADGVEVDVRRTADGVLVLSHDADLQRLTGRPSPVATTTWPTLRDTADAGGVPLATVEDVLVAAAGHRVVLEVKQPPPGLASVSGTALAVCAQLRSLERAGLPLDVTVSSFAPDVIAHVRRVAPAGVRTALLGLPHAPSSSLLRQALASGHDEVHPHVSSVAAAPDAVRTAHAVGVAVVPWTVNGRRDLRRFASLQVDAVITDVPVAARGALTQVPA